MCIIYENELAKHTPGRTFTASHRIYGIPICMVSERADVCAFSGELRIICVRTYLNIMLSTCVCINICRATYGRVCLCVCDNVFAVMRMRGHFYAFS